MTALERRYTRSTLEFRAKDGQAGTLYGYAAKYGRLSQNLGGFVERVLPSAFAKSLADNVDVLARYNHDDNALLGRTASGTLRLASDDTGLTYEVDLPQTSVGRDVAVLAARGDVYQSSFAFHMLEDEWSVTDNGFPLRSIVTARLVDVAPVNSPAYLDTTTAVRSLADRIHLAPEELTDVPPHEVVRRLLEPTVIDVAVPQPADAQRDTHAATGLARMRLDLMARRA